MWFEAIMCIKNYLDFFLGEDDNDHDEYTVAREGIVVPREISGVTKDLSCQVEGSLNASH